MEHESLQGLRLVLKVQCDIKVLLQHEGFTRIVSKVCSAKCLAGWQVLLEIMAHSGAQGVFGLVFLWDCLKIHSVSHGILGARGRLRTLNDMSVSWLFQMVFFSQHEGCCRRVEEDRLMLAYERKQMGLQGITVAEDEEFGAYGLLRLDKD
ncbi:hypothetical protein DY000_02021070 [Brassica cretica]|uniref:Uncharacterized protein n=1 Tax=Brassica cretica TaxID=69181 RepID=A0ABQ7EGM0_BRACR|nr:hypothetical protein DY000_02021070 [Brassica cretica]